MTAWLHAAALLHVFAAYVLRCSVPALIGAAVIAAAAGAIRDMNASSDAVFLQEAVGQ